MTVEELINVAAEGAGAAIAEARSGLRKLIGEKGQDIPFGFPGTAFPLPIAVALLGAEVATAADALGILDSAEQILAGEHSSVQLKALGGALNIGVAAVLAEELGARVRILRTDNHGVAAARNRGVKVPMAPTGGHA